MEKANTHRLDFFFFFFFFDPMNDPLKEEQSPKKKKQNDKASGRRGGGARAPSRRIKGRKGTSDCRASNLQERGKNEET